MSCGAVVVRKTDDGWLTLMLRAYRNWDFPKGLCEEGESPIDAAIREVGEETGITDLDFAWGDRSTDTGPYDRGKTARYYLAKTDQQTIEMGIAADAPSTMNIDGWISTRPTIWRHPAFGWSSSGPARSSAPKWGQPSNSFLQKKSRN